MVVRPSAVLWHCVFLCRFYHILKTGRTVLPEVLVVWGNKNIWKINHPKGSKGNAMQENHLRGHHGICGCFVCHLWGASWKSSQKIFAVGEYASRRITFHTGILSRGRWQWRDWWLQHLLVSAGLIQQHETPRSSATMDGGLEWPQIPDRYIL